MKINKVWQKPATAIALLTVTTLGAIALSADACHRTTRASQRSQVVAQATPSKAVKKACAKVVAENTSGENVVYKLNVRSRMFGPVVGQLDDGTTVTVIRRFPNGWVQISSPVQGYVFGQFLKGC